MSDVTYEYRKGEGWVPSTSLTRILEREGKSYRVTILQQAPTTISRAVRGPNYNEKLWDRVVWWDEWQGLPAGFGGGQPGGREYKDHFVVLTEALP